MTDQTELKIDDRQLPATVAEVALLNIKDVCAAVRMSTSWVHDEVRAGRFPQPIRFGSRCTRWSAASIRAWLVDRLAAGVADTESAKAVIARASHASLAARAKRAAASESPKQ